MILVDTGPLIALFDPKDPDHSACHVTLKTLTKPLYTTEAVLTEAFHLLEPQSRGAQGLMQFILDGHITITELDDSKISRAFELMMKYEDCPMDYADATMIVIAEELQTLYIFTLDVKDFSIYKIKKGHRHVSPKLL